MKTAGNNRKTTSNRVALYGLLIALAFVLSYVETLFPVYLGAPGVKLGLANLVTVIALYGLGVKEAFAINVVCIVIRLYIWKYVVDPVWYGRSSFKSVSYGCMQKAPPF